MSEPKQPPVQPEGANDAIAGFTQKFVQVVDAVANRTTRRILTIARVVVLAMLMALTVVAAITLLIIALIRGLDTAIGGDVWVTYFILAGAFGIIGALLWTRQSAS